MGGVSHRRGAPRRAGEDVEQIVNHCPWPAHTDLLEGINNRGDALELAPEQRQVLLEMTSPPARLDTEMRWLDGLMTKE